MSLPSKIELPIHLIVDPLTVNTNMGVAVNAGVTAEAVATVNGAVTMTLLGDKEHPVAVAADATLLLKNLPEFTYDQIKDLLDSLKPRMRVRMPFNFNFGVSVFPLNLFGVDALQLSFCGEPQLIVQDYKPNAYERCEVDCEPCDPCGG